MEGLLIVLILLVGQLSLFLIQNPFTIRSSRSSISAAKKSLLPRASSSTGVDSSVTARASTGDINLLGDCQYKQICKDLCHMILFIVHW